MQLQFNARQLAPAVVFDLIFFHHFSYVVNGFSAGSSTVFQRLFRLRSWDKQLDPTGHHIIFGEIVVPGATYLEMLGRNCNMGTPQNIEGSKEQRGKLDGLEMFGWKFLVSC